MRSLQRRRAAVAGRGIAPAHPAIRGRLAGRQRTPSERDFKFADFRQALDFTNRVGALAEAQQHHPDIYLAWGKVKLTLWTHKIDGLTESDFVFAAKVNPLAAG